MTSTVDITSMLNNNQARKLLSEILNTGTLYWSRHAETEMEKDNLTKNDVLNVLRGGHITDPGEYEKGSWRYRVLTAKICVVVAFNSESSVAVVTAWRKS